MTYMYAFILDLPGSSVVKNQPANTGNVVQPLGLKYSLEKEMATHSSVLAWRITGMAEPGGLSSMGLHRVGHE